MYLLGLIVFLFLNFALVAVLCLMAEASLVAVLLMSAWSSRFSDCPTLSISVFDMLGSGFLGDVRPARLLLITLNSNIY